jgi:hypothetical protein
MPLLHEGIVVLLGSALAGANLDWRSSLVAEVQESRPEVPVDDFQVERRNCMNVPFGRPIPCFSARVSDRRQKRCSSHVCAGVRLTPLCS